MSAWLWCSILNEVAGSSPVTHPNERLVVVQYPQRGRGFKPRYSPQSLLQARSELVVQFDAEAFEAIVVDELDLLPDDMVDGLENVVFVVEDRPEDGSLDLLGLYDGYALTERDRYGLGEMPDRIILYREPLLAICDDERQLRDEIHVTLVHEIAHFYGIDDDRLHELGWA
jgi:predicted Zn-dependent protease with MMP-like domain